MTDATGTRTLGVWYPADEVRSAQLSLHMRTTDAYEQFVQRHHADEHSATGGGLGDGWHRWAKSTIDAIDYVIHDPMRYADDPLAPDKQVRELNEMLTRVLLATDMTPAAKATEVTRLCGRIAATLTGQDDA